MRMAGERKRPSVVVRFSWGGGEGSKERWFAFTPLR